MILENHGITQAVIAKKEDMGVTTRKEAITKMNVIGKGGERMTDYKPYPKPILTDDTATLRRAFVTHCQSCGRDFASPELVYYAPLDGNIVCETCSRIHKDRQLRIYVREE